MSVVWMDSVLFCSYVRIMFVVWVVPVLRLVSVFGLLTLLLYFR